MEIRVVGAYVLVQAPYKARGVRDRRRRLPNLLARLPELGDRELPVRDLPLHFDLSPKLLLLAPCLRDVEPRGQLRVQKIFRHPPWLRELPHVVWLLIPLWHLLHIALRTLQRLDSHLL